MALYLGALEVCVFRVGCVNFDANECWATSDGSLDSIPRGLGRNAIPPNGAGAIGDAAIALVKYPPVEAPSSQLMLSFGVPAMLCLTYFESSSRFLDMLR